MVLKGIFWVLHSMALLWLIAIDGPLLHLSRQNLSYWMAPNNFECLFLKMTQIAPNIIQDLSDPTASGGLSMLRYKARQTISALGPTNSKERYGDIHTHHHLGVTLRLQRMEWKFNQSNENTDDRSGCCAANTDDHDIFFSSNGFLSCLTFCNFFLTLQR